MKRMDSKELNATLGNFLRQKREQKGISQQQIADKLGVTKTAVSYWESGKRSMYASTLFDYCDAIDYDVDELIKRITLK